MNILTYISSPGFAGILVLCLVTALFSACDISAELPDCDYNARLEYWYVYTGGENELPDYVDCLDEYLFDSDGILRQVTHLPEDSLPAHTLVVAPGLYTLVSWANLDGRSRVVPAVIGQTRLEEIRLIHNDEVLLSSTKKVAANSKGVYEFSNNEPLYYATDILEVPRSGIVRKRVNTTHAHAVLKVTVQWLKNVPANTNDFTFSLRGLSSGYGFDIGETVNTAVSGFNTGNGTVYYIPRVVEFPYVNHRIKASMRPNRTLTGDLVTYRYTDDTDLFFRVWAGDKPLIREVNLSQFFREMSIPLSRNIRQEFAITIRIDGDKISVLFTGASDWEDGGTIGGTM